MIVESMTKEEASNLEIKLNHRRGHRTPERTPTTVSDLVICLMDDAFREFVSNLVLRLTFRADGRNSVRLTSLGGFGRDFSVKGAVNGKNRGSLSADIVNHRRTPFQLSRNLCTEGKRVQGLLTLATRMGPIAFTW